ncbi:unnamed protein product, partial [Chrysoparadoxa australica]
EVEGQLYAELVIADLEEHRPAFSLKYLLEIHELMFGELYDFAGKFRTVDMSKGGFAFPSARFLDASMDGFEKNMLSQIPNQYKNTQEVCGVVGKVHAELLFIHPFREGNGRVARLFANLMIERAGYKKLNFDLLGEESGFKRYVHAIQQASGQNYEPMQKIISEMLDT